MKQKFYLFLVLLLALSFTTPALAALTFSTDAITGTTASTIDVGAGNALNLQTVGNGAVNTGTGLVTMGGDATVVGALTVGSCTGCGGGVPTTITVADTNDATTYLALFEDATGDLGPKTDAGLTYVANLGQLDMNTNTASINFRGTGDSTVQFNDAGNIKIYDYTGDDSLNLETALGNVTMLTSGEVGIGTYGPTQKLEVNGGVRLNTNTAKPACGVSVRGTFWAVKSGAGVKDTVEVCAKDAGDSYAWRTIY
jgi:hypothetical protein